VNKGARSCCEAEAQLRAPPAETGTSIAADRMTWRIQGCFDMSITHVPDATARFFANASR
jgi:hypothetical protein